MTKNPLKRMKAKNRKLRVVFSRKTMRLMAQDGGHMQNGLSLAFERSLYQAVIRYKQDHPGELEAITKRRKEEARWKPITESIAGGMDQSIMPGCQIGKLKNAGKSDWF